MRKRISVIDETKTGRNTKFHDNYKNTNMDREAFVKAIKNGKYPKYDVKVINEIETPVSKPDKSKNNNLN